MDKKGDFSCEVEAGGFVRESQGQSQITRRSTTVSLEILFIDCNELLTKKLPTFLSRLNEISGGRSPLPRYGLFLEIAGAF